MAKKATLTADIVTRDKSTANINKINKAAERMTKTVGKGSKTAGAAFSRFTSKVSLGVKKATVSLNNLNARVNKVGRNIKKSLGTFGLAVGFAALAMVIGNTINKFADFEQANASLSSVMADATDKQLKALNVDAKRLGATTARTATEIVGLQESLARLGFGASDVINMTESIISGSVAMQGELSETANLVGAIVKSFDAFESVHAPSIIDQMTVATQKSALNFSKLNTMLPTVAGAANAAGIPFNKLLALLGKLSDAGIDASSSSTALRNIILQSGKQGKNYEEILADIVSQQDKLTTSMNKFGVRAAVPATISAGKLNETLTLSSDILNSTGAASKAAAKQLDTLKGSLTILGSAWEGFVLHLEDGTGAFGSFLKTSVRVVTEILSIASGTEKVSDKLTDAEKRIRKFAETGIKLLKVVKWLVISFIAFKVAVLAAAAAQKVMQAAIAIGQFVKFVQMIITIAKFEGIWTAAQWALNAAMTANPIGLIVVGIGLLIAGIVLLVKNFDKVKAAMLRTWEIIENNKFIQLLIAPIYLTIKAIQLLVKHWDKIKGAVLRVWEPIKKFFGFVIDGFIKIKDGIKSFFGGDEAKITATATKEVKVTADYSKTGFQSQFFKQGEIEKKTADTKIADALDKNTTAVTDNTNFEKGKWKGKFTTSILKDANVGGGLMTKQIANTAITNERNIISNNAENLVEQKSITNTNNNFRGDKNEPTGKNEITIFLVNKTEGKFGIEVEGTGVNVVQTGNDV
jgi:hypothetical protein